jgi:REP element-mobilizing transposase RayT
LPSPSAIQPGVFYHIFNRGTNRENVFIEQRNYAYFMQLYAKYIEPVAETYAYCLLKNHFHLLVRMRDIDPKGLSQDPKGFRKPLGSIAFSNFFTAYAKAINKAYGRTGSLFQHPFGRIEVNSGKYLVNLVRYIHMNPQKHGLVSDFSEWLYSSYHAHLSRQKTRLQRDDVLSWFEGTDGFIAMHNETLDEHSIAALTPEDFD